MCAVPTALLRFGFAYPALTHWANLCRTSGAPEGRRERLTLDGDG
jgi:hypothetical protein